MNRRTKIILTLFSILIIVIILILNLLNNSIRKHNNEVSKVEDKIGIDYNFIDFYAYYGTNTYYVGVDLEKVYFFDEFHNLIDQIDTDEIKSYEEISNILDYEYDKLILGYDNDKIIYETKKSTGEYFEFSFYDAKTLELIKKYSINR